MKYSLLTLCFLASSFSMRVNNDTPCTDSQLEKGCINVSNNV